MLEEALAGEPRFEIDARELGPGATGYTIDTLRELRLELGADTPLWLLMGADQYAKLDSWHRPQDVKKMARIGVFVRPGSAVPKNTSVVPMNPMPVSASEIRARVARGEDIAGLVPAAVADYIARDRRKLAYLSPRSRSEFVSASERAVSSCAIGRPNRAT